jgi:ABC-type glutathione transport system ATPase component
VSALTELDRQPVVSVKDLVVTYSGSDRGGARVHALRGVSLEIPPRETLGVVGESGAGKTTLGRVLLGLVKPTSGRVLLCGQPLERRRPRGLLQVVPQNPDWSLNPHLPIWRSVAEPLIVTRYPRADRKATVQEMLERVGLAAHLAHRRPHQLSGGQRQRVAIARAVIASPQLIVFDEAVTALDASVQTQVLNLISDLQDERRFAALFISHDLAAVRYVSHRIAVFYEGQIVELGAAERFYHSPVHAYSRKLLSSLTSISTAGDAMETRVSDSEPMA